MSSNTNIPTETKILDFKSFKQKQETNNEFSRSRKPLYVNKEEGRISGNAEGAKSAADKGEDFGDRLQKIRSSLDRINSLMADLKKLSTNKSKDQLN
jgi:predicted transcriptional regulator